MIPDNAMILGLVNNAAILLAAGLLYDLFFFRESRWPELPRQIVGGLLAGLLGIIVMNTPWPLAPGIIFDTRSIMLCVSGLFLGPVATAVTVLMTAGFRIWQGGAGAYTGVSVIVASALIGALWRVFRRHKLSRIGLPELYGMGLLVHLVMLALMLTLPQGAGWKVLVSIAYPVLLIYPAGTALLGWIFSMRLKRFEEQKSLRDSELRFRSYIDNAPTGVFIADAQGHYQYVNAAATRITGYTSAKLMSSSIPDLLWPDTLPQALEHFERVVHEGKADGIFDYRHGDGSRRRWQVDAVKISDDQFMGFVTDITEQEKMQSALVESERKYRDLYQGAALGIFHSTFDGRFIDVNPALAAMLGYDSPEQVVREIDSISEQIYAEPPRRDGVVQEALQRGDVVKFENLYRRRNGEVWNAFLYLRIVHDAEGRPHHLQGFVEDITRRKQDEERIAQALQEKEILLRELYHRTKNNMQVIRSMLVLQAQSGSSAEVKRMVREIEGKIQAMALVHQMLYQSKNLSSINLGEYLRSLADTVCQAWAGQGTLPVCEIIMDDVQLTIDMAIPLGLVYNECLSNSLKYAFNDVAMPRITISGRINGDSVELGYADNGSGLPAGFDAGKCQTFGMRSIAGIIEHQLQGKMEVISGEGLQYLFVLDIARFRERV